MEVKINLEPFCDGCAMVNVQVSEGLRPTYGELQAGLSRAEEGQPTVRCANRQLCRYLAARWGAYDIAEGRGEGGVRVG